MRREIVWGRCGEGEGGSSAGANKGYLAGGRFGRTPLLDAVQMDRHAVISSLRQCGAHLGAANPALGEKLCR